MEQAAVGSWHAFLCLGSELASCWCGGRGWGRLCQIWIGIELLSNNFSMEEDKLWLTGLCFARGCRMLCTAEEAT